VHCGFACTALACISVKGARGQRGTPGASESAEAAAGPQTLVPKIEALKAHIAQMRANLKTWDEEFVGELEKCLRVSVPARAASSAPELRLQ